MANEPYPNNFKPYPLAFLPPAPKTKNAMNIENTQSQMRKGILEFCILSIIRRGEAYPSDIVDEMRAANLQILEGTLYPLLTRLKNADMLTYRWVESNSGPPRKYFSLTEKGEAFYQELEATWKELANGVKALTSKSESLPNIPENPTTN
jgi:PadR family transcriptional regulator PadR